MTKSTKNKKIKIKIKNKKWSEPIYLWWFSLVIDISNNNLDFKWVDPQIESPKFSLKQIWKNKDWQKFKGAT